MPPELWPVGLSRELILYDPAMTATRKKGKKGFDFNRDTLQCGAWTPGCVSIQKPWQFARS